MAAYKLLVKLAFPVYIDIIGSVRQSLWKLLMVQIYHGNKLNIIYLVNSQSNNFVHYTHLTIPEHLTFASLSFNEHK